MSQLTQHPNFSARKLGKRFGYVPDPPKLRGEKPDRKFNNALLKTRAGNSTYVDLSDFTTDTNQLRASSCVGNATADAVEVVNAIEGRPRVELSRLFVYSMCRALQDLDRDGKGDIDHDEGTWVRLAFCVLQRFGICTEEIWPYDLRRLYRLPSLKAMREATGHRIHSYYRITSTGNTRLDLIIDALRSHHPVVFGTQVTKEFMKLRSRGPVPRPKGNVFAGGHAMMIIGYVPDGFLIKNSWGPGWGEDGFCVMAPEYLSWKQSTDFWVPTLGTSFR